MEKTYDELLAQAARMMRSEAGETVQPQTKKVVVKIHKSSSQSTLISEEKPSDVKERYYVRKSDYGHSMDPHKETLEACLSYEDELLLRDERARQEWKKQTFGDTIIPEGGPQLRHSIDGIEL